MTRDPYQQVLDELGVLQALAEFEPTVIGTPPLGIDVSTSDIDVACTASDLSGFKSVATAQYGDQADFAVKELKRFGAPSLGVTFSTADWEIELFCQQLPISEQWGVRHFNVEQRVLLLCPELREQVIELKQAGVKTEPAFAQLLDLQGDPYEAVLELENWSDEALVAAAG